MQKKKTPKKTARPGRLREHSVVAVSALVGCAVVAVAYVAGLESRQWLAAVCLAVFMSVVATYYSLKNLLAISYRKRIFDVPDARRIHVTPTPRLGGYIFSPVIICTVILSPALLGLLPVAGSHLTGYAVMSVAMTLLWSVGSVDDTIGVRYKAKFAAQIAAAALVVFAGFWIRDLHGFCGIHALPAWVGMPLTVLFVVAVINAFNLIDGMDGLASGLGMLTMGVMGVRFFTAGMYMPALVAFAALGTLAPFFYTNVHGLGGQRHKMFMGDTGSMSIGLVASILALILMMFADEGATGEGAVRRDFVLAVSPLLVPLLDMVHVAMGRVRRGSPPFLPDKTHIHHRLLDKGFGQRRTLWLIIGLATLCTAVNWLLAPAVSLAGILLVDVAVWGLFNSPVLRLSQRVSPKRQTYP